MMNIKKIYILSLSVVLLIGIASCKNNSKNEPVLSVHIPLNEGDGTEVSEIISGLKGFMINMNPDSSWVSGLTKSALHFDGKDDHIIIPNNPAIDFGDEDFTVSFLMRWPKGKKPFYEHLLTKGDYDVNKEGETGKRWEITFVGGRAVCFNIDDNINRSSLLVSLDEFVTGDWVHVVMVRDTENKQIRAYANGILQKSIKPYDPFYDGVDRVGNISNPQDLYIGDASRVDNPFEGEMSDIRIYKSVLTQEQIINITEKSGIKIASKVSIKTKINSSNKPRVLVTSDGEIDDECSLVRFLLYTNEWDVEGIITSSSQYHWHGHRWAGDDWANPYLDSYEEVYPNLKLHDDNYPTPEYLKSISLLGNVESKGEMDSITAGSQHIVKVLLDDSDDRPIWLQAWGGTNTIARALKTIEEEHPEKMEYVANKIRFYFIWEQDNTYQKYIRPNWGKYNIPTIISDQFWAIAYQWDKIIPESKEKYFRSEWMKSYILEDHGSLCSLYKAHEEDDIRGFQKGEPKTKGDFRSEGDSPAFLHTIPTGLRNMESPEFGGWGGRYVNVRENTWLDPVLFDGYEYPEGRWFTKTAWGRNYMRDTYPDGQDQMNTYFNPLTRWADVMQNDFAARADWCVNSYEDANHPPVVLLDHPLDRNTKLGRTVKLKAKGTYDPDGDDLIYKWWQYEASDSYEGSVEIQNTDKQEAFFEVPDDAKSGDTIHIICEVSDDGEPSLTRYRRVIITVVE